VILNPYGEAFLQHVNRVIQEDKAIKDEELEVLFFKILLQVCKIVCKINLSVPLNVTRFLLME
jgi:hypothetical protein